MHTLTCDIMSVHVSSQMSFRDKAASEALMLLRPSRTNISCIFLLIYVSVYMSASADWEGSRYFRGGVLL